jgi:hypothetical protein
MIDDQPGTTFGLYLNRYMYARCDVFTAVKIPKVGVSYHNTARRHDSEDLKLEVQISSAR